VRTTVDPPSDDGQARSNRGLEEFASAGRPFPPVDVVVVAYNSAEHIEAAVCPLVRAGLPVIVVDNASSDDTVTVASTAGCEVVTNDVNVGFGAAANQGARRGSAPFVLFLNPDAAIALEELSWLVERLDQEPGTAIVAPRIRYTDGTLQRVTWPFPSPRSAWMEAIGLSQMRATLPPRREAPSGGFVIGACFLMRRSVFEELNGFDERFWLYAEEADLCYRARQAGWDVSQVDEVQASHVGGASGSTARSLVAEHFDRGAEHFVHKHHGPRALLSLRVAQWLGSLLRVLVPGSPSRRDLHRARLARLTRVLTSSPLTVAHDNPATSAPHNAVIVCSLERWDEVWRRNQFFVRELLARHPERRVLFVEPPFDVLHERRQRSGRVRQRGIRPVPEDGRVLRFEPVKILPRRLGPMADWSMRWQVRRAAAALGITDPALWVNDASYAGLARETGWRAVYDITDDWIEAGTDRRSSERIRRNERSLFSEADAVVVCSAGLEQSRRSLRDDVILIPNGVDVEHFRTPQERPGDLPPRPVAVYVGTLHEDRLDVDLCVSLATARPDLSVVLIGPDSLSEHAREMLDGAGVQRLGPRPYRVVPAYLQHADAVIVPHVVSPFTESLDPIKAYECVAVGRPTVATPVAGFRELEHPVVVAETEEFVGAVEASLRDPGAPPLRPVADWGERGAKFVEVLDSLADRRARELRVLRIHHSSVLAAWRGRDRALRQRDVDVTLVSARRWNEGGRDVPIEDGDDFVAPIRSFGSHPYTFLYDPIGLWRVLRSRPFDVIDVHEEPASLAATEIQVLAWLAGARAPFCLYSAQNIEKRYPPPFRWLEKVALRRARGVHTCNDEAIAILRRKGFRGLAVNLGLGVDLDAFRPPEEGRQPGRHVGYVGRLERYKGVEDLLDAVGRLEDCRLTLVGEGPLEDELRRRVADRPELQVTFLGFVGQEDLPALYSTFDVLAVPSRATPTWIEQFGRVAVEAMACGVPVVATRTGALPEVVGAGGVLVDPGDPGNLAAGLRSVLDDSELASMLRRAAVEHASQYSWDAIATQQRELYRLMVHG
jgi:glycosyltransferase involved in cell wall biosynthesis/GT2 family glycosyltransferase